MLNYIFKHFANFCMACVMLVSFFIFIFQLISVNASRDALSNSIRRTEKECTVLKQEIRTLDAERNRLCNDGTLKRNDAVSDFKEATETDGQVIRVRTISIPRGTGRALPPTQPKALAIQLVELAARN